MNPAPGRRPLLAILFSIIPGLGHLYLGLFPRGLLWFAGIIVVAVVMSQGDPALWLTAIFGGVLVVAAAFDAWILLHVE